MSGGWEAASVVSTAALSVCAAQRHAFVRGPSEGARDTFWQDSDGHAIAGLEVTVDSSSSRDTVCHFSRLGAATARRSPASLLSSLAHSNRACMATARGRPPLPPWIVAKAPPSRLANKSPAPSLK